MNINEYFRNYKALTEFIDPDGREVSVEDQEKYIQLLRSKLNTFKTHEEQIAYVKKRRQKENVRAMDANIWQIPMTDSEVISDRKGYNSYYNEKDAFKESSQNMTINSGFLNKRKQTAFDHYGKREANRTSVDKLENMKNRANAIKSTEDMSSINKKTSYVKKTRDGEVKYDKQGNIKQHGQLAKKGINFYNNTVNSKLGQVINFIITNAWNILIGIGIAILLVVLINIIAGAVGFKDSMGKSPFVLCGGSTDSKSDDGDDDSSEKEAKLAPIDVSKLDFENPKLEDVELFGSASYSDDFGVTDKQAEKVFLDANLPIAKKYNITKSNIGNVSKEIRKYNVSPVFFYAYTMNENPLDTANGSGFINHYPKGASAEGVIVGETLEGDIKADAKYIVKWSNSSGGVPATGGGEPGDMPTGPAEKFLKKMPKGSIGRMYVQATSAVTAEIADLSGQKGSWSGKFGPPLTEIINKVGVVTGKIKGGTATSADGDTEVDGGDSTMGNCDDGDGGDEGSGFKGGLTEALKVLTKQVKKVAYGSGQCYALASQYIAMLTEDKYNLSANSPYGGSYPTKEITIKGTQLSNNGRVMNASEIWSAYNWKVATDASKKYKFKGVSYSDMKYKDLQVGDIVCYTNNFGQAGHVALVVSIDGKNKYSVIEQNTENPDGSDPHGGGSPIAGPRQADFDKPTSWGEKISGVVKVGKK